MIYIKTEMKEMPKGCRWLEGSLIEACEYYQHCKSNPDIFVIRSPFEPERAICCPLVEIKEADK